ncbi:hypothetical protein H0H93_009005 [Arthromyces matolae]|nr:hypothetical protein H0H93_009005 [Arthromyces matolae]
MASLLSSKSYIFDPRPNYPLFITATRYWLPDSKYLHDPSALTLVFTHAAGLHKEIWQPTIEDLFALSELPAGPCPVKIREAWSIDAPDHGDAGVLNELDLKMSYNPVFSWEEYARAIYVFLSNHGKGLDVDLSTHRLVGIGHSLGAGSLLLSLGYSPNVLFKSLILVEPLSSRANFIQDASKMLVAGTSKRRDIWPSFEEAYDMLKSKAVWKAWDDRVLRKFVNHGLRPLPTAEYPDKFDGVTLKCTRRQETANCSDSLGTYRSYNAFKVVTRHLPVHLIYGAINDFTPQEAKDDVVEVAIGGTANLASLHRIEGAGHSVVQTDPTGLAHKIYESLTLTYTLVAKL